MGVIKSVLEEEMQNSQRLKKGYERELQKIPKGSLIKKNIKGHDYYYLVFRDGDEIKFKYLGKLSQKDIERHEEAKKLRAKYKNLLRQSKQRIKFIERALRGSESV